MLAATMTFRESTASSIGIRTRASATSSVAALRPAPSAPTQRTSRVSTGTAETNPASDNDRSSGVSATMRKPAARNRPRSASQFCSLTNGSRSAAPIDVRTALR
jgi:hypothetical protein